jgi:hypothetical protein
MTRRTASALSFLALATALTTGSARADADDSPAGERPLATRAGTALQAGGGVARFLDSDPRSTGGSAGYWELRAAFGTRRFIGSEVAYVGSARPLPDMAAMAMVSHGVEAVLRINSTIETAGGLLVEPFTVMGLGWTRFAAMGEGGTAGHHVLIVPVGLGLAFGRAGFLMDLRLSYRPILAGGELLRVEGSPAQLQSWTFGSVAGVEF